MLIPNTAEEITDEIAFAQYILQQFSGSLVVVHPEPTPFRVTATSCAGRIVDANPGGIMLVQEHPDGTRTKSFFMRGKIVMIEEVNFTPEMLEAAAADESGKEGGAKVEDVKPAKTG